MITIIPNPPALSSPVITRLYISNPHSSFASFISSPPRLNFPHQRRRFQVQASSFVLPLLPFPIDQVLVPSEVKTLHLYEARYIALLEESLFQKNKLFVHFVLDPIGFSGTSVEASFAARYGCLVIIEKVERLEIGALVLIRGVGRVKVLEFKQVQPYLTGEITSLQDTVLHKMTEISSKVLELKEALYSLNSLEIKLKPTAPIAMCFTWKTIFYDQDILVTASSSTEVGGRKLMLLQHWDAHLNEAPGEALLQTQTTNSLVWAEKQLTLDCITDFIPSVAERVSFAALQPVSGATQSELLKLQREKLTAMDVTDTLERLEKSIELARENISMLAAKLAIQSLEMH